MFSPVLWAGFSLPTFHRGGSSSPFSPHRWWGFHPNSNKRSHLSKTFSPHRWWGFHPNSNKRSHLPKTFSPDTCGRGLVSTRHCWGFPTSRDSFPPAPNTTWFRGHPDRSDAQYHIVEGSAEQLSRSDSTILHFTLCISYAASPPVYLRVR